MLDAGWLKRQWAAFEARGKTGRRPPSDPCLEALWPALDGKMPVAFEADTADQIHRALDFADGVQAEADHRRRQHAWKVADRLKAGNVPVILRLDFASRAEREADLPVRVREDRERQRKEVRQRGGAAQGRGEVRVHDGSGGTRADGSARTSARPSPPACRPTRRWPR